MSKNLVALLLTLLALLGGCSGSRSGANLPPVDDTAVTTQRRDEQRPSIVTKKNMVILAGAAALYYLYKKHQNKATGPDGQYYLSKNGRVYYRDAQHRAHWVTAPSAGISVPADEASAYQDYQGYDGRATGRDLTQLAP